MSEFVVEPWINELGQTINPGDQVVAVGTSWKRTKIMVGVFEGVRYGDVFTQEFVLDENGMRVLEESRYGHKIAKRIGVTKRMITAVRVGQIPTRQYKYDYDTKTGAYVDGFKKSTLPLKRVFKIDTTAAEMSRVAL